MVIQYILLPDRYDKVSQARGPSSVTTGAEKNPLKSRQMILRNGQRIYWRMRLKTRLE